MLDTFQLTQKINSFKDYTQVLKYIKTELSKIIRKHAKPTYIKRFFYTQAAVYKDLLQYDAQRYLYELSHEVTRGIANG